MTILTISQHDIYNRLRNFWNPKSLFPILNDLFCLPLKLEGVSLWLKIPGGLILTSDLNKSFSNVGNVRYITFNLHMHLYEKPYLIILL